MFPQKLNTHLDKRKLENNFRTLPIFKKGIDFFSNDYLGLAHNNELLSLLGDIETQLGTTGSRLISGNTEKMEQIEAQLGKYYGGENALFFSSGFMANLGLFSCLGTKEDTIIYDQHIHASTREGVRLSSARSYSFRHNDYEDLEKKLKNASGDIYVAIEGIYSMHGDIPNSQTILELQKEYGFYLIVDEAHSVGILGDQGKGWSESYPPELIFAKVVTFGKAMGNHGALVVGNTRLKEFLINFSKPFIYTTSLPESEFEKVWKIHEYFIQNREQLRIPLFTNIVMFNKHFKSKVNSPIQIIQAQNLNDIHQKLEKSDIYTKIIRYPTVPQGEEIIRICLHNFNTEQEMQNLLNNLTHE